jgi:valyl-tRNA synthetase
MDSVLESVRLFRNLRAEERVAPDANPDAWVRASGPEVARVLERERGTVTRLARLGRLTLRAADAPDPTGTASRVAPLGECYLARPAEGRGAAESLARERAKLAELLAKTRARLADDGFRRRAPAEVVREAEEKATELAGRIARLDEHLSSAAAGPSA